MSEIQSTQDKYRRVQKANEPAQIKANEVRITTGGRVKNYVDYATRLFEGTAEANNEQKDQNTETNDENNENNENNDDNNDNKPNTKKFDSIVLKATGKAINKAVTTAEIVKRTIGDLHQETSVETLEIVDIWEPTEEGLQQVETTRRVASISIKLSRKADLVDINAPGYQKPIPKETGFNLGGGRDNRNRGGPRGGPMGGDPRDRRMGGGNMNRRGNRNNRGGPRGPPRDRRGPGGGRRGGYGGPRGGGYNNRGGNRGGPRGPRNNNYGNNRNNYPYRGQGGGQGGGYNNGGGYGNQGNNQGYGNRGGRMGGGSPGRYGGPRNDGRRRGRGGPRRNF